jgi:hypothetical protein
MADKNAIHAEVEGISEGGEHSDITLPNQILPRSGKITGRIGCFRYAGQI